ncbi:MAG: hypothetical protein Q6358_05545, partial [Candidatus Brocadiales bacterium]|nr:hypothetical protein [Candidatus Brocadiales bacterium]
ISPAFWSAVAAVMSALIAFFNWKQNRLSFIHTIRPEISIEGYDPSISTGEGVYNGKREYNRGGIFNFKQISNYGKGPAFNVKYNLYILKSKFSDSKLSSKEFKFICTILKPTEKQIVDNLDFFDEINQKEFTQEEMNFPLRLRLVFQYEDLKKNFYESSFDFDINYADPSMVQGEQIKNDLFLVNHEIHIKTSGRVKFEEFTKKLLRHFKYLF